MIEALISFDIETTGLSPVKDKVIEIGGIKIVKGKVVEEFSRFVNPYEHLSEKIIELTGIQNHMLKDAEDSDTVIGEFMDFIGELPVLGHNIIFDYSFIKIELSKKNIDFQRKGIDTLMLSRRFYPELESRSLESMCRYYGIKNDNAHRALSDAKASYSLYQKLYEEFYQSSPEAFEPENLIYKIKRQEPITKAQKNYLIDLIKYHKIEFVQSLEKLTKSEASRYIDKIILEYGRIK